MSNTPKKDSAPKENKGFSPLIIQQSPVAGSPQKNLTGTPRVARDIIADIYNNIQHWNDSHIKGAKIVKQIAILKSDDPKTYSLELEVFVNDLFNIVGNLETYKNRFEQYSTQIKALRKLQRNSEPLFISLDAEAITNHILAIAEAYIEEFKLKQLVLENIAHAKNKHNAMFFAACWTHQIRITSNINTKLEILLVETGFRMFS